MKFDTLEGKLRFFGFAEALSWLLLLFIAMPLKYIWHAPLMVKRVGWVHGIFFIAYFSLLGLMYLKKHFTFQQWLKGVVFSFLPFGTLAFDRTVKITAEKFSPSALN